MAMTHARTGRAITYVVGAALSVTTLTLAPVAADGAAVVWDGIRSTVAAVASTVATLAPTEIVAGHPVAAIVPAPECSSWERAILAESWERGESLRLACVIALTV
jgi:hypothetical protein